MQINREKVYVLMSLCTWDWILYLYSVPIGNPYYYYFFFFEDIGNPYYSLYFSYLLLLIHYCNDSEEPPPLLFFFFGIQCVLFYSAVSHIDYFAFGFILFFFLVFVKSFLPMLYLHFTERDICSVAWLCFEYL